MHRWTIVFDYRLLETVLSLHLYVALLETSKGRLSHSFYVVGHMQPTLVSTGLLEDLIQTFNYFQDPDCASLEADDVWACRILIGWQESRNRAGSDSRAQSTKKPRAQKMKHGKHRQRLQRRFSSFNALFQLFYYSIALSRLAHRHAVTHPAHCPPPTTARTAGWRTGLGVERAAEVPSLLGQIFLGHPTLTYTPATAPSTCVGRAVHPILPAES